MSTYQALGSGLIPKRAPRRTRKERKKSMLAGRWKVPNGRSFSPAGEEAEHDKAEEKEEDEDDEEYLLADLDSGEEENLDGTYYVLYYSKIRTVRLERYL